MTGNVHHVILFPDVVRKCIIHLIIKCKLTLPLILLSSDYLINNFEKKTKILTMEHTHKTNNNHQSIHYL